MPANLNNLFGESCCDGGECSTSDLSAKPCGCDPSIPRQCKDCYIHDLEEECKSLSECLDAAIGDFNYLKGAIHFFFKRIKLSDLDDSDYKYFKEVLNYANIKE